MPKGIGAPDHDDLPGDIAHLQNEGYAEGESIWIRMATICRVRRLDLRVLLDDYDKHKRNFYSISTFRAVLCNAFAGQWYDLSMTSAEFEEICAPYLTRKPKGPGEPEPDVIWSKFANHITDLANKSGNTGVGNW